MTNYLAGNEANKKRWGKIGVSDVNNGLIWRVAEEGLVDRI